MTIYSRDRALEKFAQDEQSLEISKNFISANSERTTLVGSCNFYGFRSRIAHEDISRPSEKEGECVLAEVGHPFLRSVSNPLVQLPHRPRQHGSMPRPDEPRHPVHTYTHTHTHIYTDDLSRTYSNETVIFIYRTLTRLSASKSLPAPTISRRRTSGSPFFPCRNVLIGRCRLHRGLSGEDFNWTCTLKITLKKTV